MSGQEVRFTLQGDSSVAYTVTASSAAGSHSFSGMLRDSDTNDHTVGGATRITVRTSDGGGGDGVSNRAPVFREGTTAARSVAEEAVAGASVGSPVTASDSDGDSITYSLAGADANLFAINTRTGQISVAQGTALDFETRSSYSVRARANDGRNGQGTIAVTIAVTNVEEAGTVSLSSANPEVGVTLTAMLEDPDGGVSDVSWSWERSMNLTTWMAIPGSGSDSYTPTEADEGYHLRATAAYSDGHGPNKGADGEASSVTVDAPSTATPSATRSFNPATVAPGGTVTVTIQAANYGQAGGVTETLPSGFSYVSSSLSASQVNESGQNVGFTLQGDTSFTYTVTASSTPGPYDFSGTLRDSDTNDHTVGGATSVTVQAPGTPTPSATRSFSSTSVAGGGRVVVTIQVANYGGIGRVTETLPAGFAYVDSTHGSAGVSVNGQEVRFTLQVDSSVAYTVTASRTAGSHSFSGMLRDSDTNDHTVGGATRITVRSPSLGGGGGGGGGVSNRAPVFREGTTAARSVAEEAVAGASVGSPVTASDSDGDSIAYSLVGDDANLFAINTRTGQISVAQGTALDFEDPEFLLG